MTEQEKNENVLDADETAGENGNAESSETAADGNGSGRELNLEDQLKAAKQEAADEHDRVLRVYAEFDNYKKRSTREMSDFRKFANEKLFRELLPFIDNLERAVASADDAGENQASIIEGIQLTLKDILQLFEKFHVKPVEALGQPFNPNFHEAVGQEESEEYGDNIVVKEFQKGYLLHERLIRPSMVVISKAKTAPEEPTGADEAEEQDKKTVKIEVTEPETEKSDAKEPDAETSEKESEE